MRVAGWTLIVMAVILHFSACEWTGPPWPWPWESWERKIVPFLPFVQAREQFYHGRTCDAVGVCTLGSGDSTWIGGSRRLPNPARSPCNVSADGVGMARRAGRWLWRHAGALAAIAAAVLVVAVVVKVSRTAAKTAAAAVDRGNAEWRKGDYDTAVADFTEAIRLDPKDALSYFCRGKCYENKGEYDKAIADFTEAIRLDPKFVAAYEHGATPTRRMARPQRRKRTVQRPSYSVIGTKGESAPSPLAINRPT